jgi:hypothetical protein
VRPDTGRPHWTRLKIHSQSHIRTSVLVSASEHSISDSNVHAAFCTLLVGYFCWANYEMVGQLPGISLDICPVTYCYVCPWTWLHWTVCSMWEKWVENAICSFVEVCVCVCVCSCVLVGTWFALFCRLLNYLTYEYTYICKQTSLPLASCILAYHDI